MCLIIATTFTVAWLPYQLNNIVLAYGNASHALVIHTAAKTLTFVNSCLNPIIYALMWRPFRASLIQVGPSLYTHCTEHSVSVRSVRIVAL